MRKKDVKSVGLRLPVALYDFASKEAEDRGVDLTVVIIDALNEYKKEKDPNLISNKIIDALRKDPTLLVEPLKRIGLQFRIE